eukprot:3615071-Rhodomonas_salina.1
MQKQCCSTSSSSVVLVVLVVLLPGPGRRPTFFCTTTTGSLEGTAAHCGGASTTSTTTTPGTQAIRTRQQWYQGTISSSTSSTHLGPHAQEMSKNESDFAKRNAQEGKLCHFTAWW